jgi:hypothetical protein
VNLTNLWNPAGAEKAVQDSAAAAAAITGQLAAETTSAAPDRPGLCSAP